VVRDYRQNYSVFLAEKSWGEQHFAHMGNVIDAIPISARGARHVFPELPKTHPLEGNVDGQNPEWQPVHTLHVAIERMR